MSVNPLTLKDCAFAARLHQNAFYKGWTEEDFQEFLRDSLVFGLKISNTSVRPERRHVSPKSKDGRRCKALDYIILRLRPLRGLSLEARTAKEATMCAYILWREVEDEAEILTLVVNPSFQRKGLGHHLLEALLKRLKEKGVSKLFLEVAKDNEKAKLFYIKNGFHFIGKRPNYYERPGHTFVDGMSLIKWVK